MSKKLIPFLVVILSIVSLLVALKVLALSEARKEEIARLELSLSQTEEELSRTQEAKKNLEMEKAGLEEALDAEKEAKEVVLEDLSLQRERNETLDEKLEEGRKARNLLQAELDKEKLAAAELETKVEGLTLEKEDLQGQFGKNLEKLKEVENALAEMKRKEEEIKRKVEQAMKECQVIGKIWKVQTPSFLVIDLGKEGSPEGRGSLFVQREGKIIAELKLKNIFHTTAVVEMDDGERISKLEEGSQVRFIVEKGKTLVRDIRGKISAKKANFISIDLTEEAGIASLPVMEIFRGDEVLDRVEIRKVHHTSLLAEVSGRGAKNIQEGDSVTYGLE